MLTTQNSPGLANRQPGQEQLVMKVRIVRNTVANKEPVEAGQVLDLPEAEARLLIAAGKAEADNSVIITEAPVVETADVQPVLENAAIPAPRSKRKG